MASPTVGRPPGGRAGGRLVTAFLQLRDAIEDGGHLYLFSLLVALIWVVWLVKVVLSRRYAPWTE